MSQGSRNCFQLRLKPTIHPLKAPMSSEIFIAVYLKLAVLLLHHSANQKGSEPPLSRNFTEWFLVFFWISASNKCLKMFTELSSSSRCGQTVSHIQYIFRTPSSSCTLCNEHCNDVDFIFQLDTITILPIILLFLTHNDTVKMLFWMFLYMYLQKHSFAKVVIDFAEAHKSFSVLHCFCLNQVNPLSQINIVVNIILLWSCFPLCSQQHQWSQF